VSISGHTDGKPFTGANGTSNWELSAARANAARAMLSDGGLSRTAFTKSRQSRLRAAPAEDPNASANRRLSIVLLREPPPVPPGHQL